MKIGFFADGYLPQKNGVATAVAEYAKALEELGHEVIIIAPRYPGYTDTSSKIIRLRSLNVKKEVGIRLALYLPERAFLELLKLDFDIIHGHGDGPITFLGWSIAKRKNLPFIFTHHTFWNKYTHYFPGGRLIRPAFIEKFTKAFANSCDYITTPSMLAKTELESYGVQKPIQVVNYGLDLTNYKKITPNYLHRNFAIPKENKIVLYVGRLNVEKSVDVLLHSFKYVQENTPKVSFVLIGEGPEKEHLQRLAKKLGIANNTHFVGTIDYKDMPQAFKDADVFAFSSKTETLGKVVLEALAAGTPTVTLNEKPFTEIITQDVDGKLVEYDPSAFAHEITTILSNTELRKKLQTNGFKKIQRYSILEVGKELVGLYETLIAKNKLKQKKGVRKIIHHVKSLVDVHVR